MGKNFFEKYFSKAGVALIYNLCAAAAILSCPTVFGSGSTERGAAAAAAMEVKSEKPTGGTGAEPAGRPKAPKVGEMPRKCRARKPFKKIPPLKTWARKIGRHRRP